MKIKILAAADRNNYGDLLFPLILLKFLEKESLKFDFKNYGIISSDLTHFGALPTESIDSLIRDLKKEKSVKLIIAGGEVLGDDWLNILRFISPFWNQINKFRFLKKIINKTSILNKYYTITKKGSRPFILDHKDFRNNEIIYNSVGALAIKKLLENNEEYVHYFKNISFLSVRDIVSARNFERFNIHSKLVPDSALIMSDFFECELNEIESKEIRNISGSNYAFVQLGKSKGPDDLQKFKANLEEFSKRNDLRIILCPLGMAMDHSDQVVLTKLAKTSDILEYYHPKNIYEIMFLIKHSKIFIGTSLHGVITAQSFVVPFIGLTEKIQKLEYYIKTWCVSPNEAISDFDDFKKINKRLDNFNAVLEVENLNFQKSLVYRNLYSIFYDK